METSALLHGHLYCGQRRLRVRVARRPQQCPSYIWLGWGSELVICRFETRPLDLLLRNVFPFGAM